MTEPMTDERLEVIKRRAEKATPGDWLFYNGWGPLASDGLCRVLRVGKKNSTTPVLATELYSSDIKGTEEDFEFITHARTDIPALVEEVERLREENERAFDALLSCNKKVGQAALDLGRARELLERTYDYLDVAPGKLMSPKLGADIRAFLDGEEK